MRVDEDRKSPIHNQQRRKGRTIDAKHLRKKEQRETRV